MTGLLLAVARISGETAPLLFTALNNQFFSTDMSKPMANLPVVIFQFAMSPYDNWIRLAWAGALLITLAVLAPQHHCPRFPAREKARLIRCCARPYIQENRTMNAIATATATAPQTRNALELRNLNFFYGQFQGLKNVNLDIEERKVTAFIGPSGCGKSTLLRTLNRMYSLYPGQRAEGQINFYGQNILDEKQDINLLRARIGMVFQKPTPFPMSIYDNIAFGVKLYESLSDSEMDDRVEWALSKAALWGEVKDKLHQSGLSLSGGQQQRLCIARSVAVKPSVLLARRAHFGARPDLNRQSGRTGARAQAGLHHCHRDAQHAAGRALQRLHRLHVPGGTDRIRVDRTDLLQTHANRDRRLHHRPLRLTQAHRIDSSNTVLCAQFDSHKPNRENLMGDKHISSQFDTELNSISTNVLEMGGLVESQLHQAVYALIHMSLETAEQVLETEQRINQMELNIDHEIISTIGRRQPTARDLRFLMAISRTTQNLERAGDEVARMARMVKSIIESGSPRSLPVSELRLAADLAAGMLRKTLDSFARLDTSMALAIIKQDDEIDIGIRRLPAQADHLHDGRSTHNIPQPGPAVPGQVPGARGRPRQKHRRADHLCGQGRRRPAHLGGPGGVGGQMTGLLAAGRCDTAQAWACARRARPLTGKVMTK